MANWAVEYLAAHPELASLPLVQRHRHGFTHLRPDGLYETTIVGMPAHYEASPGDWQPIDTTLQWLTDHYGAPGVPVLLLGDGTSEIDGGTYSQRTVRVGILRPSTQSIIVAVDVPIGRMVNGDTLSASGVVGGAHWTHELRLVEDGLREVLTLESLPDIPQAQAGDYLVLETQIVGPTFADGWIDGEWNADGMFFPLPSAEDANGDRPQTRRFARTVDGVQYVYTGVPVTWLASAAYPVAIDPDYAGMSADGYVYGSSDIDYSTARSTSISYATGGTTVPCGQTKGGSTYQVYRPLLKFDVSSIPDTDAIMQINMKLVATADWSDTDFDVQIIKQDWSAQDPLTDLNRETAYDNCLAGTADGGSPWRNTSGMSINTQYTSPNLDTDWFPASATAAYYSLRSKRDADNISPVSAEFIRLATADHATEAYRPVLTVLHGAALVPIQDITVGVWLPSTVAADLYTMIDEVPASDADYIYSPTAPDGDMCEVKITALGGSPGPGDIVTIIRHQHTAAPP